MFYTFKLLVWSLLLASSIAIGMYLGINGLNNYKEIWLYVFALFIDMGIVAWFVLYWRYISMPYALNLYGKFIHNTFLGLRDKRTVFLDFFVGKQRYSPGSILLSVFYKSIGFRRFDLYYFNPIAITKEPYEKNAEQIIHFLGLHGYSISIKPKLRKIVKLSFYKLPESYYYFDILGFLKRGDSVFLGIGKDGFAWRKLESLDHHLVVGESGAGKSNFMHVLLLSLLHSNNMDKINNIYLVDLKGGIELKHYENIDKMYFVYDIKKLDEFLDFILFEMNKILKELRDKNIRKAKKYTFIFFDEIGAISSYPDKKLRESIFRKLALIAMQGRAAGILLFAFAQKIDTTILPSIIVNNLQTRVLFKTSSDHNINLVDLKENLRKMFTMEVQDFPKGRCIYKDGVTSDKILLQVSYVSDAVLLSLVKYYEKIYPKSARESA